MTVAAVLGVAGLLGLLIGSFLNVAIYRIPLGESVIRPASHCPGCGSAIRARHNVPIVSWLVLRGRCANCRARISIRYPLVEAGTAAAFVAVTARLDALHLLSAAPAYLYFTAVGIALAAIDLECRRLPNALVVSAYPVLTALLALSAGIRGDWWSLARGGEGALALLLLFGAINLIHPAGMGMGDVKLAGVTGLVLGYLSVSAVAVGSFATILGSVVGLALIAWGAGRGKTALPFGPFLIGGVFVALFATDSVTTLFALN